MSVSDPIADMLTRIRNANKARHDSVIIPSSGLKKEIAKILDEEGYIKSFEFVESDSTSSILKVYLKYGKDKKGIFSGIKRVSKPGLRVYVEKENIPFVLGGMGIAIMSTSSGVMTGKKAKQLGVGGEVICYIW
jgi:small subunit ribosomal protein S8